MDITFLLRGLVIGFSSAAPVGPIGVLCIRRTLANGRAAGLVSGLGAATADAIYGCIAGFGLKTVKKEQLTVVNILGDNDTVTLTRILPYPGQSRTSDLTGAPPV